MAAKSQHSGDAIEEFEGLAERGAAWVSDNLILVAGIVVLLLGGAFGVGYYATHQSSQAEEASDALDRVQSAYLKAMGAEPGAIDVPELANPTAAAEIREEYAVKFGEVAEAHAGTVAGVLARLEQGNLSEQGGDLEASIEIWRQTLAGLSSPELEAIVHQRIAQAYEDAARWTEAAEAHERAAGIDGYPLRYFALADAARCFAMAGDDARARGLAARIELEAPTLQLPDHLRAKLQELRGSGAG